MRAVFSEGVWARWGLLASAFALGAALMVASWANYRGARRATTALHLGQGRIIESALRDVLRPHRGGDELDDLEANLEQVLAEQGDNGLRYLALLDRLGRIAVSVGDPAAEPLVDPRQPGSEGGLGLVEAGSRVRMFLSRPRPGPVVAIPEGELPETLRHGGMILEFEPLIASGVMDQAGRLLIFGLAAALAMMAVAAASWGMSLRYERAKRRLEQERRLSLLGEMSAVLAHEIRNPLASLKGHSQLLAEHLPADSPDRRKAERVVWEASRLEALTADLLDFVRIGPISRKPVDPVEILRASADEVDPEGFDLDVAGAPREWSLDGARLHQALTNLLRNARQASPAAGSRPIASISTGSGRLIFTIRDHGDGLPKGQEERVFDPFFTTRTSGTGLGLAVARRIVELHDGKLVAANHPKGGAVFQVALPGEGG